MSLKSTAMYLTTEQKEESCDHVHCLTESSASDGGDPVLEIQEELSAFSVPSIQSLLTLNDSTC